MKIELQTARGEFVRDLEIPKMTPAPDIVTLGARCFRLYNNLVARLIYREAFMVSLEGYLPGQGLTDPRAERV